MLLKYIAMEIIVKTLATNHEMFAYFNDKKEGVKFANYYKRKKNIYSVIINYI